VFSIKFALWNTALSDDEWSMYAKCQEELSGDSAEYERRKIASEKAICRMFRRVLMFKGNERKVAWNGAVRP
jgi:hypothetical protein